MFEAQSDYRSRAQRGAKFVAAMLFLWLSPSLAQTQDVTGVWLTDDGRAAVEITPCSAGRCGKIVWLREGLAGALDAFNPDLNLRSRKICGLPILLDLKRQADGSWDEGQVYDPEEGKTYSASLELEGGDRLRVTGYIGVKVLGESHVWSRANLGLKRC